MGRKEDRYQIERKDAMQRICIDYYNFPINALQIIVSDPEDGRVYTYTSEGKTVSSFSPQSHAAGLAVQAGGVCVTPLGQILLVDSLNHVINLYTESGDFLQQVSIAA